MSDVFSSIGGVLGNVVSGIGNVGKTIGSDIGGIFSGTTPSSAGGAAGGGTGSSGGWLGTLGKILPAAAVGMGTVGNYLSYAEAKKALDQQMAWNKWVQQLVSNPAAFQKFAAGYTQPLTAGLTQGVLNQDQAWLATHGLSQSPAIAGDIVNQSLAPYIQQQQNQGVSNALAALGAGGGNSNLASSAAANLFRGTDLTGLLRLLQGTNQPFQPVGGGNPINPMDMGQTTGQDTTSGNLNWNQIPDLTAGDLPFGDLSGMGGVSGAQQ